MVLSSWIAEALREYRRALELAFPGRVERLVVFGSVARGEADEDSDVDVLVVLDRLSFPERGRVIDLATEIGLDRGLLLRPIALQREEWEALGRSERLLAREVERDGIEL